MGCLDFSRLNTTVYEHLSDDILQSVKPWFSTIINKYKVMLYNGQLDLVVPVSATDNFLRNLGLSLYFTLEFILVALVVRFASVATICTQIA